MVLLSRWRVFALTLAVFCWGATVLGQGRTRASLLLEVEAARPGETFLAAVRLEMPAGWHTYWRNPGESGKATEIRWKLPPGVTAGAILWPAPESYTASDMTTYVYHREVWLLVPLTLAGEVPVGTLDLEAEVDWLECEVACVPGTATVRAQLAVGSDRRPSTQAPAFVDWLARVPRENPELEARAFWEAVPGSQRPRLIIEGRRVSGFSPVDFYGYPAEGFDVLPAVTVLSGGEARFRLSKPVNTYGKPLPRLVSGILVEAVQEGRPRRAYEVILHPEDGPGGKPSENGGLVENFTAGKGARGPASLGLMLGLAFLGGLILNIMPCVLPVIALKILGFVQQSREEPARVRQLSVVYALGVLASFLVLAGVVIQVQQAGGAASWGMQMQNPQFRVVLLVVVTLVALNLFGVFEVMLPGRPADLAAGLAGKSGAAGAFFSGVLATALATPCTAPFLAVALGFAFTQPPGIILLMFATVATGLAFPYVLLSWKPAWLRFVPRPGPWMQRFKVAMGFPMLATGVWLLDFTAPSFGESGLLWLGLFLVLLAVAAWVWGEFVQRGSRHRVWAMAVSGVLLVASYWYVLEGQLRWRSRTPVFASGSVVRDHPDGIEWHPWSPEAVDQARAAGHPVLVDFTAKWCLTCQSNKRLAIEVPEVRARLRQLGYMAFRADNTDPDPRIAAELRKYNRAGVPLVLVFPADLSQPPLVLPEILTPSIVLDSLRRAAGVRG